MTRSGNKADNKYSAFSIEKMCISKAARARLDGGESDRPWNQHQSPLAILSYQVVHNGSLLTGTENIDEI